jgi:hypothetical protein
MFSFPLQMARRIWNVVLSAEVRPLSMRQTAPQGAGENQAGLILPETDLGSGHSAVKPARRLRPEF